MLEKNLHSELTLHIVLATIPQRQEKEFNETVIKEHFENYRNHTKDFCSEESSSYNYSKLDKSILTPVLYNPLRYYILGNYDIAYVSLIDNFKFAQRLFEPGNRNTDKKSIFSPHSFQSFTGINNHGKDELKNFFFQHLKGDISKSKYFLGICNLKLNNGFLIGNGNLYINEVKEKIRSLVISYNSKVSEFNKVEILLLQTFSWFEFSLIIFTNNPASISEIMTSLRGLSIISLKNKKQLLDNSLYSSLYKGSRENLAKANVFADTHTYVGLHADLINKGESNDFVNKFLTDVSEHEIKLLTEIEWQVKPGHMHLLVNLLEKSKLNEHLKLEKRYMLAGKTDYYIQEKSDSILTNFRLLRLLFDKKVKIFDHIRKVQTRVLFEGPGKKNKREKARVSLNLQSSLRKLGVPARESKRVDERLKSLKISRQIRSKINKIFSNYNNGIQDVILFPFFLDFKIFIDELMALVNEETIKWAVAKRRIIKNEKEIRDFSQKQEYSVSVLEDILMKQINIFQEGFYVRTLNCYQYEDITDFDLDFNGSLQQLLSAYSSLITELAYMFYSKKPYQYGPVVQLNLKDTLGNYNSINYYVHHLSSPEFVFATVTKEILNNVQSDTEVLNRIFESFEELKKNLSWENRHLKDFIESQIIRIDYSITDTVRFIVSYDMDFDLFYYWFWTHNLQNPLLFDKSGLMNEIHFQKELFRVLFVAKYFNIDIDSERLYCPLPELYTFWERHFHKMCDITDSFIKVLKTTAIDEDKKDEKLHFLFSVYLNARANQYIDKIIPEEFETPASIPESADYKVNLLKKLTSGSSPMLVRHTLFGKKDALFEMFTKGNKAADKYRNSLAYTQWHMLSYLKEIMSGNNNKISFLRRNWDSGLPLRSFILANQKKHLYKVDQTGGLFFSDMSKLNAYMKLSSKALLDLIHLSMISKKKFILYKLNIR